MFDADIGLDTKKSKEKKILCVETGELFTEKELKKAFSRYDYQRILKVLSGEFPTAITYHWKVVED